MRQPGDRAPAPPELALVQDLVNTLDIEGSADSLRTSDDLARFATGHGLAGLSFGATDLARCRALREALRDACHAHAGTGTATGTGAELPAHSAELLADAFRRAPVTVSIDPAGAATVTPAPGLRGADALVAQLAAGIATGVVNRTWPRLKACTSTGCRWVYYDHSPAGRGRWCTMQICGSRAKVRTWRQRQKPDQ